MKKQLSPRVTLIIIAAMFVLPLAVAWFMYTGTIDYKPGTTRNLGQLIEPPVPLSWNDSAIMDASGQSGLAAAPDLLEHWVILKPLQQECDDACLESVITLRQVHKTTGRNQSRVRVALLLPDSVTAETSRTLQEIYPEFRLLRDGSGEIEAAMARSAGISGQTYLVDPLGNIMMAYEAGSDPNHLKKDLKRLLTWSKLDE